MKDKSLSQWNRPLRFRKKSITINIVGFRQQASQALKPG